MDKYLKYVVFLFFIFVCSIGTYLFLNNIEHGEDITWTHFELVPYLLLYFDLFYTERKLFKKNIFKSISYVCWLYTSESKIPISQKLYYKLQILQRYGVLNVMKYTFPNLLRYRINMFLPRSIKDLIKSIIKY